MWQGIPCFCLDTEPPFCLLAQMNQVLRRNPTNVEKASLTKKVSGLHVQDGIHLPFESVLDFEILAVRIAEDDLPNLITILRVTQHTLFSSL